MKRHEDRECKRFVKWLDERSLKFSHLPLETFTTSVRTLARNRSLGVRKGIPDYIVFIKSDRSDEARLLFIEMKRPCIIKKNGDLGASPSSISKEQKEWISDLDKVFGVNAKICFGSDDAIMFVRQFLKKNLK